MEPNVKRVKTHDFETNEDAEAFLDQILPKNVPELDKDIWEKMLLENKQLSVRDIERLCNVNSVFRKFCKKREIWKKIFDREASPERQKNILDGLKIIFGRNMLIEEEDYMLLVFLNRILSHPQRQITENKVSMQWNLGFKSRYGIEWKKIITYSYINNDNNLRKVEIDTLARTLNNQFVYTIHFETYAYWMNFARNIAEREFGFRIVRFGTDGIIVTGRNEQSHWERFLIVLFYIFVIRARFNLVETPSMHLLNEQLCSNISCNNKAKTMCGICKKTPYCSQRCANLDWDQHLYNHCK